MAQKLLTLKQISNLLLGFGEDFNPTKDQITAAYRKAAFIFHPDRGGSNETFRALSGAKEILESSVVSVPQPAPRPYYPPPPPTRSDYDYYGNAKKEQEERERQERNRQYEEQRQKRERQQREQQSKKKFTDIPCGSYQNRRTLDCLLALSHADNSRKENHGSL